MLLQVRFLLGKLQEWDVTGEGRCSFEELYQVRPQRRNSWQRWVQRFKPQSRCQVQAPPASKCWLKVDACNLILSCSQAMELAKMYRVGRGMAGLARAASPAR